MGGTWVYNSKETVTFLLYIGNPFDIGLIRSSLKICNSALQLGPLVRQMMPIVEASPVYSMARNASGSFPDYVNLVLKLFVALYMLHIRVFRESHLTFACLCYL